MHPFVAGGRAAVLLCCCVGASVRTESGGKGHEGRRRKEREGRQMGDNETRRMALG